ncbi:MAG TPA: trypsin-like peptidase domain-containing protein [Usitatibacter sp.]|nr:trypsin-like peptidase domain-containing protein [Usitatibacter sp.]
MRLLRTPLAVLLVTLAGTAFAATEMPSRAVPFTGNAAAETFRAPGLAVLDRVQIAAALPKSAAVEEQAGGRLRVATVRELPKAKVLEQWQPIRDGFVTRLRAASTDAEGLRVRLEVSSLTAPLEMRAQGSDGRIVAMTVQPGRREAWTPWTEGDSQEIELFSRAPQSVTVTSLLHFTTSPTTKAAGSCTIPTNCTTDNPTLDAAIREAKKSVMRINFIEGGSGFLCTATLVNSPSGQPFVLTANHCVSNPEVAATVTSWWFYDLTACDASSGLNPNQVQQANGMQFVFGNHNVDSTLMLLQQPPPPGAVYAGWNANRLGIGDAITSISHPTGDTARIALGVNGQELRIVGRPQDMYAITFTRGIIQGGSSGSGLFTLSNGALQLRGVLSGTTIRNGPGMSCTNTDENALYGRLELFHPQIDRYLRNQSVPADDAPNRPQEFTGPMDAASTHIDLRSSPLAFDGRRIDAAGDIDLYLFSLSAPAVVSAWTEGANLDTVGNILDSQGNNLEANDDAQTADNHFGLTMRLDAGTYFVQVGHFDSAGTGSYNLRIRADSVDSVNRTALWWNAAEPGWGLNVNHQGNKIFATLFTYDASGPMWLVMSDGARQADGSYEGALYRTAGSGPFGPATSTEVGRMRIAFQGNNGATLTYSVNGTQVTKALTRQEFSTLSECTWSAFDRSFEQNYQDLWSNAAEPGWGVNLTQQGNTLFATLFTYDSGGRPTWLVMSAGAPTAVGGFSGPLYRTSGPVFNAAAWMPATATQVGTMTFTPSNGNRATLTWTVNGLGNTKQVTRQAFGAVKPLCE